jgi:hypothetical protein
MLKWAAKSPIETYAITGGSKPPPYKHLIRDTLGQVLLPPETYFMD